MLYALKIATRYLTANKAQTALLVFGVAVGVFIFIFMSALIGGLAEFIMARTAGDLSHVTIEAEAARPAAAARRRAGHRPSGAGKDSSREARLANADAFIPLIEALPGVTAISQQITGAGFLTRGAQVGAGQRHRARAGQGLGHRQPGELSGRRHRANSAPARSCIGKTLAEDMNFRLGQTVRLQARPGIDQALTISGIYEIGSGGPDRRQAYVSLATARTLFAMPQGVSRIEIKLADLYAADATPPGSGDHRAAGEILDGEGRATARGAEGAGADRATS